jgi:hypothetical protein
MNNNSLKFLILIAVQFIYFNTNSFGSDVPENESGVSRELNVRAFYKINDSVVGIAEIEIKDPTYDLQSQLIRLGSRYSLNDNFKIGIFISRARALKHDNNWVKEGQVWGWNNSKKITETSIYPELSYRNLFGEMTYELKLKYAYSSLYNERDLYSKFILIRNLSNVWTFILSDEIKFSLTDKERIVKENWLYFNTLFKVNSQLMLGPLVGYSKRFWTTSENHSQLRSNSYESSEKAISFGLVINFYIN